MQPDITENYFKETARVLKPDGRAVFSFFVLDFYQPRQKRPLGFGRSGFNFDYPYEMFGSEFRIANPSNPEEMTAYKKSLIQKYAAASGLEFVQEPIPGFWSDSSANWVGAQDIVVLKKHSTLFWPFFRYRWCSSPTTRTLADSKVPVFQGRIMNVNLR